jgi:hypothetical protein
MEQEPVNDNDPGLHWALRGPDEDDAVWLDHEAGGRSQSFNLGDKVVVHAALSNALAGIDYFGAEEAALPDGWKLEMGGPRWALCWEGAHRLDLGPRDDVAGGFVAWLLEQDGE